MAQGYVQKQIAWRLGIDVKTVSVHVCNAAHKIGPGRPAVVITRFVLMAASTQAAA